MSSLRFDTPPHRRLTWNPRVRPDASPITRILVIHEAPPEVATTDVLPFAPPDAALKKIIEANPDGVLVIAQDGPIRFANPAAARLLGRTTAALVGTTFGIPLSGEDRVEVDLRHRDGTTIVAEMRVAAIEWEGQPACLVSLRDVSERKALEAELVRRAEELAAADRRKDQFLAVLSHELRNPLTPLRNALEVLRLRGSDPSTVEWARGIADRQVRLIAGLVDDLLDVSRIGRGKIRLQLQPMDLTALVQASAEDQRIALESAGLLLEVRTPRAPVEVRGDAVRLSQCLNNLVGNARKFSDQGGRVTIALEVDKARNAAAIRVRDEGAGIEPEMLERVFDPFAQADRTLERSPEGLGLGLALVKGLVELHGGRVEATSAGVGKGAEFTIWLPLAA